ncbi:MAG: hypothetical protein WBE26_19160 [Phycisphaerae bacterium]
MMAEVRRCRFDLLVCYRLDRISRSLFLGNGVAFVLGRTVLCRDSHLDADHGQWVTSFDAAS